ncbi:hypothetical protein [Paenibacillus sp. NPDC058071]|uniref:hypothetical protein n=1 Tax=Paenibacillus sp. NPDC058071 TaxID=3346326 RepID=UPI0036DA1A2D
MRLFLDREAALEDLVANHVDGQWQFDFVIINQRYMEDKERIDRSLLAAFEQACVRASLLQQQERKGEINYIQFSYLRTSLMEQRAEYRIDLYDAGWYMDREECASLWQADFLFEPMFERTQKMDKQKARYGRLVTAMDIEHIQQQDALKYHLLAVEYLRDRLPALLESEAYAALRKSESVTVLAGEFRDQHEILYPAKGEEE